MEASRAEAVEKLTRHYEAVLEGGCVLCRRAGLLPACTVLTGHGSSASQKTGGLTRRTCRC